MNYTERFGVEPAAENRAPIEVFEELLGAIKSHLIVTEAERYAIALWVIHTYLIQPHGEAQVFRQSPILHVKSPDRACGKSTARELVSRLVPRPDLVSNLSGAALFRTIELEQPTMLIDEADQLARNNSDLWAAINDGYRPDGCVKRMGGATWTEVQKFRVFCAKMLVGIGDLPETTASRCIAIRMKRKLPGETITRISDVELEDPEFFPRLRADILRFAIDYKDQIGKARPRLPDLGDRQRDNWEPLLRIAQVIDQDLAVRCISYPAEIEVDESDEPSVFELLLFDVAEAFEWGVKDRVYSRELLATLIQDPTKQWATYRGGFRPINEADVARMLRRYGVTPKTMRISGRTPAKGYEWADLHDAVQRYLPPRREPPLERAVTP